VPVLAQEGTPAGLEEVVGHRAAHVGMKTIRTVRITRVAWPDEDEQPLCSRCGDPVAEGVLHEYGDEEESSAVFHLECEP
jgi:hypothetical protein